MSGALGKVGGEFGVGRGVDSVSVWGHTYQRGAHTHTLRVVWAEIERMAMFRIYAKKKRGWRGTVDSHPFGWKTRVGMWFFRFSLADSRWPGFVHIRWKRTIFRNNLSVLLAVGSFFMAGAKLGDDGGEFSAGRSRGGRKAPSRFVWKKRQTSSRAWKLCE